MLKKDVFNNNNNMYLQEMYKASVTMSRLPTRRPVPFRVPFTMFMSKQDVVSYFTKTMSQLATPHEKSQNSYSKNGLAPLLKEKAHIYKQSVAGQDTYL